jgi:HlyD family secretion protein
MLRKYILPLAAVGLVVFAVANALYMQRPQANPPPPVLPPLSPYGDTVAGAGMVEPSTEASGTSVIAIGSQLAGVVTKVNVRIGQVVKIGDLLFELDERLTNAQLKVNEAQVAAAEATVTMNKDQRDRGAQMLQSRAISEQDMVTLEQTYRNSQSQLELARAQVAQTKTQLAVLQVRAPVNGSILQINVRPGEYVATVGAQSLIQMGSLQPIHVRVNVDEEDLPRLKLFAPARAKIRGDAKQEEVPMTFVRLEPYVVPKTSLTGSNTERVDTRVVQVIYAIDPNNRLVVDRKILVGQLVDVFIDTRPSSQPGGLSSGERP